MCLKNLAGKLLLVLEKKIRPAKSPPLTFQVYSRYLVAFGLVTFRRVGTVGTNASTKRHACTAYYFVPSYVHVLVGIPRPTLDVLKAYLL